MRVVPVGAAFVAAPEPEQEGLQPELRVPECQPRGIPRPAEVPDRFVVDRRDVHRRQIAGPQEARELGRVPAVSLDPGARLPRNQRRGDDLTAEAAGGQVPIQAIPARAGLIREAEVGRLALEPAQELRQVGVARANVADEDGRIGRVALGVGHGDGLFVDVESDEKRRRLLHG